MKRYEEALKIIKDTETLWPSAPDFTFSKGDIYFLQNRFDDAKEVYQSILANSEKYNNVVYHYDRKSFLPYERLGRIYQMEKNDEQALQSYIKALNENFSSVHIITNIVRILSEYHTAKEVYEFLMSQNVIKTNAIRLDIVKYLLSAGYIDLAIHLAVDLEDRNKDFIKVIDLKAKMITNTSRKNATITFEKIDLLLGIQEGLFDLADLCILYSITKEECIEDIVKNSKFKHIFEWLFTESGRFKKIKQEEYVVILRRAIRYNQIEFVERLIILKKFVHKNIDAKIADLFYENGYEDIAMDFYELSERNHITKQGYINMIEWLISQKNIEEAYKLAIEALDKFKKDFRFYKYAIEFGKKGDKTLFAKALNIFPDSSWLKK
ncbi:glycosyl transferase family 2 [Bacillus sp. G3(2015)]|nr:glycosyl transferase family 2 [Bacillus sp. G3(2015)]